jgi:hypothetical protein
MAKKRGGVAIDRCGIVNSDLRLEFVINRRDGDSISSDNRLG